MRELKEIISGAMYDSKYEALTKGYRKEVDRYVQEIKDLQESRVKVTLDGVLLGFIIGVWIMEVMYMVLRG